MSYPVIKVEQVSKSFMISHETPERYLSLRDEIAKRAGNLLSLGRKQSSSSRELFYALKDVNFEIKAGDRVGIIGRNGAGKSTLLKVLSRITEPSSGRITIRGRVASLLEVGTGFHPELTGRENIFLNGAILGMGRAEIRKKFDEIVDFAEVEKFLDTPVKRYSSGMYVRLAFAVAAHLEPEILVVDEVLAVGDAQFQQKCLGKMEEVSINDGRTLLFVSHNMGMVSKLCNLGVLLNKGRVEENGLIRNVIDKYLISNNESHQTYIADELTQKGKANYFRKISTLNSSMQPVSDYIFNESITLKLDFVISELSPNILIGIGIQDKSQNVVCSFQRPLSAFTENDHNQYSATVLLPPSVIAPNLYSFRLAIWIKDIAVFDLVENICQIKIHDNGGELALFEGMDYGSFVLKPTWQND